MGTKFDSMDWKYLGDQFRALAAEFPGTVHDVLTLQKNPNGTIKGIEPDSGYPDFAKYGTLLPYMEGGIETADRIVCHGLTRTRGQTWDIDLALSKFRMAVAPYEVDEWLGYVSTTCSAFYQTVDDRIFVPDIFKLLEKLSRENEAAAGQVLTVEKRRSGDYTITKRVQFWTFHYNGKDSAIPAVLRGLPLLEILLTHPNTEYSPAELLRAAGMLNDGDSSIPDTITDRQTINAVRNELDSTPDDESEENLRKYIGAGVDVHGKLRQIQDRGRKRVGNLLLRVYEKADSELRNHFETFATPGTNLSYRPDHSIRWIIS